MYAKVRAQNKSVRFKTASGSAGKTSGNKVEGPAV